MSKDCFRLVSLLLFSKNLLAIIQIFILVFFLFEGGGCIAESTSSSSSSSSTESNAPIKTEGQVIGRSSSSLTNGSMIIISSPPKFENYQQQQQQHSIKPIVLNNNVSHPNRSNSIEHVLSLITNPIRANGCPPTELVRPCKCLEHSNDLFFRTLLLCNGSDFKYERRFENILHRLSKRLGNRHSKYFDWLQLVNLESVRKITKNFFAGIRFRHLVIEDAPQLKHLHPAAFKPVTNLLRYFYAYNTGLEAYRMVPMKPPLGLMRNLTEVHIASRKNICPPKEIIFPCECMVRKDQLMPFKINRQKLKVRCTNQRGIIYNVTNIFNRLNKLVMNQNKKHPQWYFDEVILRNVTELNDNAFGSVDFSELHIEHATKLRYISRNAFSTNTTLQKLRISGANFTNDRLSETFDAINRLKYLRSLYIWSCIIEFVPEMAFANMQFYLKEIVLYGNNIKAIGSFAFANLPNLEELRIDGNNIILVDKYAFATNYTSLQPLRLTLVANNLDETSFAFMAMNGAQRPVHLSFAEIGGCYWNMKYLDEQIFAPFLDKSTNRVYLEPECELQCEDCRMKWLTEIPKHAQKRITLLAESNYRSMYNLTNEGYVPCQNGVNLYDIYEFKDWDSCN